MKKTLFAILISIFGFYNLCFSQVPSMGQIQKTQQDLEMEKALRTEAEKGKKVLIKKITVKGARLITKDKIKEIILPFQKHWLTQSDIDLIINSITYAYRQKGYQEQPSKISYQIKKANLEIDIIETKN